MNLLNIFKGEVTASCDLVPVKIENRPIICTKCNVKFYSDLSKIYQSSIPTRVLCICECGHSFTIKAELSINLEKQEMIREQQARDERKAKAEARALAIANGEIEEEVKEPKERKPRKNKIEADKIDNEYL